MKDSYSFDRDEAGLDVSVPRAQPRLREDLRPLRPRVLAREGGVGADGRLRERGLPRARRRRREPARRAARTATTRRTWTRRTACPGAPGSRIRSPRPRRSRRRASPRCEALAEFLDVDHAATSKAMPVTMPDGTVVLALVRGDDRLAEEKLMGELQSDFRPATDEEIRAAFGASGGSLGPVGFAGRVVADETLRTGQFVAGANRDGCHLRGVEAGRDYEPQFADIRTHEGGRHLPGLRRRADRPDGDRARAHLQARHALLRAARRDVPRRGRHPAAGRHGVATASVPAA